MRSALGARWLVISIGAVAVPACQDTSANSGLPSVPHPPLTGAIYVQSAQLLADSLSDSAWAGTTFVTQPTVFVGHERTEYDNEYANLGLSGVAVACAVTAGGGSVQASASTTNVYGLTTCGTWTLGFSPGVNVVTVSVPIAGVLPVRAVAFTRPRPNIVAHYVRVGLHVDTPVSPQPVLSGEEIFLGEDGSLEFGDEFTQGDSDPILMPSVVWRLLSYSITGTTLHFTADSTTTGEFHGDTLVLTAQYFDYSTNLPDSTLSVFVPPESLSPSEARRPDRRVSPGAPARGTRPSPTRRARLPRRR